jgi:Ca2+-binding EF-hand superfamily protein
MTMRFNTQKGRIHFVASILVLHFAFTAVLAESPSAGSDELFKRLDSSRDGTVSAAEVPSDQKRLFERLLRRADADGNRALSRDEFLASLVPSRPEKAIEEKQPDAYPQANAVRYLLLTMDTNRNGWIEADEVPEDLRPVFEILSADIDANDNGTMDRYELSRNARQIIPVAARYVAREQIDVAKELKKFDKTQGELARRFDEAPRSFSDILTDPTKAQRAFKQFDANSDGQLELAELPEPLQQQMSRFMLLADRDRDGGLSVREFLLAAERAGRAMKAQDMKSSVDSDTRDERLAKKRAKKAAMAESIPAE